MWLLGAEPSLTAAVMAVAHVELRSWRHHAAMLAGTRSMCVQVIHWQCGRKASLEMCDMHTLAAQLSQVYLPGQQTCLLFVQVYYCTTTGATQSKGVESSTHNKCCQCCN